MRTIRISKDLVLARQDISKKKPGKKAIVANNIVFWLDVSGSMSGSLPKIRQHLKNNLPNLVKPNDTITLGWFSSKGEFGILQEGIQVKNITDLTPLNTAIDRYLRPVGLTGFLEPLKETVSLSERLRKQNPGAVTMVFTTDGWDNQWDRTKILDQCKAIKDSGSVDSAFVAEYGYYCDRKLLGEMAESIGGTHIFTEDYPQLSSLIDKAIQSEPIGVGRIEVKLDASPFKSIAFVMQNDLPQVLLVKPNDTVDVLDGTDSVYYLVSDSSFKTDADIKNTKTDHVPIAGLLAVMQQKGLSDELYEAVGRMGDSKLFKQLSTAFGKQSQSELEAYLLAVAAGKEQFFVDGFSDKLDIDPNAYCVVDLMNDLVNDEGVMLMVNSPNFYYKRTTAKQEELGEEELSPGAIAAVKAQVENLSAAIGTDGFDKTALKEYAEKLLQELSGATAGKAKFEPKDPNAGVPMSSLTWNSKRPNLSVLAYTAGYVVLPSDKPASLPDKVDSHIYRNYTIILDGILNMKQLPVKGLSKGLFLALKQLGVVKADKHNANTEYVLDLSAIPVINRSMALSASAEDLFKDTFEMQRLQAIIKVLKNELKTDEPAQDLVALYGAKNAAYLESIGVTKNGFSPSTKTVKSGDFYMGIEIATKIAGVSSLPSVDAVSAKVAGSKKLTLADQLMVDGLKELEVIKKSPNATADLESKVKSLKQQINQKMGNIAKTKFGVVLGQKWFTDFADKNETTKTLHFDKYGDVSFTVEMKDVEVKI